MKTVKGNGVSIGTAIGTAFIYENEVDLSLDSKHSFLDAVKTLTEKYTLQIEEFKNDGRVDEADVLDAYILVMQDPEISNAIDQEKEKSVKDVFEVFNSNAEVLKSMEDEYFRQRAEDIISVGKHVVNTMQGIDSSVELEENSVLVASDLTPADTSSMNMNYVKGIILKDGGPTSHAVIVAKNLGIPCIIGIGDEIVKIQNKDTVSLDGESGEFNINPDETTIKEFEEQSLVQEEIVKGFTEKIYESSDIEFRVNVGSNEEIESYNHPFLKSIGLFRSEFIYLDRSSVPTTEEQKKILEKIQEKFSGTIVYRTLDIGGDKQVDYLDLPNEENPFLGVRGIRLSLSKLELFETQIESILTSKDSDRTKIMFPMISTLEDFHESNMIVESIAKKLNVKKPDVGIMIETPSSTLLIEEFCKYVDFFSIGTNDLTQYIMAADRGNPNLIKYQDTLHPSILRTLDNVISISNKNKIEISVCGEMSSDGLSASVLYVLGLRVFSMSSTSAPFVFQKINKIKEMDIKKIRKNILSCESSSEVRDELKKTKSMTTHAILLAGGSSNRFSDEENKVYFPIGRKPALCWPLETLERSDYIDSILLVIREEDWDKTNNVIELVDPKKLIGVTVGGDSRHESEYEGLKYLKDSKKVKDDDLILIHDGARPLLPDYLVNELIDVAKKYGASAPGFNSKNLSRKQKSTKDNNETIVEIQTPQVFPANELWKSYELAKLDNWQAVDTTECVSKYLGMEAMVIPGDPINMKVTFIEDIFELEKLIED